MIEVVMNVGRFISLSCLLAGFLSCTALLFLPNLNVERWLALFGVTSLWGIATALFWSA